MYILFYLSLSFSLLYRKPKESMKEEMTIDVLANGLPKDELTNDNPNRIFTIEHNISVEDK